MLKLWLYSTGMLQVMFTVLIPLGYSNFVAIETVELETMVQGSHGNIILSLTSHIDISC